MKKAASFFEAAFSIPKNLTYFFFSSIQFLALTKA